jgi:hypothetical protein
LSPFIRFDPMKPLLPVTTITILNLFKEYLLC